MNVSLSAGTNILAAFFAIPIVIANFIVVVTMTIDDILKNWRDREAAADPKTARWYIVAVSLVLETQTHFNNDMDRPQQ